MQFVLRYWLSSLGVMLVEEIVEPGTRAHENVKPSPLSAFKSSHIVVIRFIVILHSYQFFLFIFYKQPQHIF